MAYFNPAAGQTQGMYGDPNMAAAYQQGMAQNQQQQQQQQLQQQQQQQRFQQQQQQQQLQGNAFPQGGPQQHPFPNFPTQGAAGFHGQSQFPNPNAPQQQQQQMQPNAFQQQQPHPGQQPQRPGGSGLTPQQQQQLQQQMQQRMQAQQQHNRAMSQNAVSAHGGGDMSMMPPSSGPMNMNRAAGATMQPGNAQWAQSPAHARSNNPQGMMPQDFNFNTPTPPSAGPNINFFPQPTPSPTQSTPTSGGPGGPPNMSAASPRQHQQPPPPQMQQPPQKQPLQLAQYQQQQQAAGIQQQQAQQMQINKTSAPQTPGMMQDPAAQVERQPVWPPLTPEEEEKEFQTINILLDINQELFKALDHLQTLGRGFVPVARQNSGDSSGRGQPSPTGSEPGVASMVKKANSREALECSRRIQGNLHYLATIADRIYKEKEAPKRPHWVDTLPNIPGNAMSDTSLKALAELYAELKKLYPNAVGPSSAHINGARPVTSAPQQQQQVRTGA